MTAMNLKKTFMYVQSKQETTYKYVVVQRVYARVNNEDKQDTFFFTKYVSCSILKKKLKNFDSNDLLFRLPTPV